VAALAGEANPGLRKYMLVGYYTGARRYTLWSLKEHHVNLKTGTISLPRPKGHRDLVLRMNDKLKAELATWLTGDPQAFLLPRLRLDSISRAFRRLNQQCVRLKVIRRAHSFHAIRHTTAPHMALNGEQQGVIRDALGHVDLRMLTRYTHLSPSVVGAALNRL
jgi:integrase